MNKLTNRGERFLHKKYISFFLIFCGTFCSGQNLIENGSFEDSLGNPSLEGWYWDTLYAQVPECSPFSDDVPPNDGTSSVILFSNGSTSSLDCNLIWFLTNIQGAFIYNLRFWTKHATNMSGEFLSCWKLPSVAIGRKATAIRMSWGTSPCTDLDQYAVYIYDSTFTDWRQITLVDTISSSSQDSIAIILHAGGDNLGKYDSTWFDLVELIITDTLASVQNTEILPVPGTAVFPNPFSDHTIITFRNERHERITLTISTILGQPVKKIQTNEESITIQRNNLPGGIYFFELLNANSAALIGKGKMVIQ